MSKLDQTQRLHRLLLSHRYPLPLRVIAEELECSEKTAKRAIDYLRDSCNAPLEYVREPRGWAYTRPADQVQLPGLWLTGEDLQALTSLLHLIGNLSDGLLREDFKAIEDQVERMLTARGMRKDELDRHIRILPIFHRNQTGTQFNGVAEALMRSRQIKVRYVSYEGKTTDRILSPQTLVHYRENWYLDAWCHLKRDLRTFALARIQKIELLNTEAEKIAQSHLEQHFSQSYGIFSGAPKHTAKLRFMPAVAREIAMQQWHPQQQGEWDGTNYLLTLPYAGIIHLGNCRNSASRRCSGGQHIGQQHLQLVGNIGGVGAAAAAPGSPADLAV